MRESPPDRSASMGPGGSPLGARRRFGRRVLATAAGLLAALAVLEGALALAALVLAPAPRMQEVASPKRAAPASTPGRRVLCVGDSNTYGLHLAPEESYPRRLAELLAAAPDGPWHVANAGVPGRNSAEVRHYLAEQLEHHRPDIVIAWAGINSSWSRAMAHLWDHADGEAPMPTAALVERLRLVRAVRLLHARQTARPAPSVPTAQDDAEGAELFRRVLLDLRRMRELCDEAGARLLVLDYPYDLPYVVNAVNPAIARFAVTTATTHLSLQRELKPVLRALGAERHVFPDAHLKTDATAEVARLIAGKLVAEGWVPDGPWADAPPLTERVSGVDVAIARSERGVRIDLVGTPGAPVTLRLQPWLLRTRRDHAEACTAKQVERGWDGATSASFSSRDLGALAPDGALSVELPLPVPPSLTDPVFEPGTEFFGWRLQARTVVQGVELASAPCFVTVDGRLVPLASRAALLSGSSLVASDTPEAGAPGRD